nr:glutamine amidotransferase [Actinomycetota bacterium]
MNLTVVSVYPTLLGTYGDGGNVMALRHRARLHGIEVDVINIEPGDAVPESAELYVLGGGEDSAQTAAANALRNDGSLKRAAERGAAVLAVCAGYQLHGEYFP